MSRVLPTTEDARRGRPVAISFRSGPPPSASYAFHSPNSTNLPPELAPARVVEFRQLFFAHLTSRVPGAYPIFELRISSFDLRREPTENLRETGSLLSAGIMRFSEWAANSLCRAQGKRTMCEPEVQVGN